MSAPAVTVAVVSWNTRELLVRCLRSLAPHVQVGLAEVWVVDNASSDGSAAAARAAAPWATVLELHENVGFGRAVNLVAARTTTPWLAAANADVELAAGALPELIEAGESGADWARRGALAPRLVLPDGRTQHSVFPLPTPSFTLMFNLGRQRLDRRWGKSMCLEGYWDGEERRVVPWAIAAFLLLRRSAFDAVGGFDERQWVYAEDLDLGWRLAQHGWSTWYEPSARVWHVSGAATELAFGGARRRRFMRETYAVIARREGPMRMRWVAAINSAGVLARLLWMAPLALLLRRLRRPLQDAAGWLPAHLQGLGAVPGGVEAR